jgi:hypothetical protein
MSSQAQCGADRSSSPRRRGNEIKNADVALVGCNKTNRGLAVKALGLSQAEENRFWPVLSRATTALRSTL